MKKKGKFSPKNLGDFFRGGSYTRGRVWGGLLGIKRPDRGKKNFRGPEIFGGGLFGEMQKRGGKTFLGSVGEL